jgi:hypothetical protein
MGSWRGLKGKLLLKGVVILAGLGCCWPAEDDEVVPVAEPPLVQDIPVVFKVVATGLSTGDGCTTPKTELGAGLKAEETLGGRGVDEAL